MKTVCLILLTLFVCYGGESIAQQKEKDTVHVGREIKKGAKKVGNKTAEVGAKAAAKVKDKSLKNVKGPNGETVYIDKYQRKYYINKKGKRIYL